MKLIIFTAVLIAILSGLSAQSTNQGAPGQAKRTTTRVTPTPYLFVWTADADEKDSDFLAVIDANPDSQTYAQVVATLPDGARATFPHHTEYEFPKGSILFANGWGAGRTFLIDLNNPKKARLAGQFNQTADYVSLIASHDYLTATYSPRSR
ncbi:MAG: hypothetical protein ABR568_08430 [Pyrinomonadaceae bacterium]